MNEHDQASGQGFSPRAVWRRVADCLLRFLPWGAPAPDPAGRDAYNRLRRIFAAWQHEADEIDILQARKWLTEGPALDDIVADITGRRHNQFNLLNDPRYHVDTLLDQADTIASHLSAWDCANLHEMRRLHNLSSGMTHPERIDVLENALKHSEAQWLQTFGIFERDGARAAWDVQKPIIERIFALRRDLAQEPARRLYIRASEVLLEEWNPYTRNKDIDLAVAEAKKIYPAMLRGMEKKLESEPPPLPLPDHIPHDRQLRLFRRMADSFLDAGGWTKDVLEQEDIKIAVRSLPNGFCWGSPANMIVALESYEDNLMEGLGKAMHELGHMLYLLALNRLPDDVKTQPVARVNGYSTHEASAMFFEQLGMTRPFFETVAPMIRAELGVPREGYSPEWSAENLHALMTRPKLDDLDWGAGEASLIPNIAWRTIAERKILDGDMSVDHLPQFWAKTMREFTGRPHDPDDFMVAESHWFDRQMGYFWAYVTGAKAASILHDTFAAQNAPPRTDTLAAFLVPYAQFMQDRVYARGCLDTPHDLLSAAAERPVAMGPYLDRLGAMRDPGAIPVKGAARRTHPARKPGGPHPDARV